MTLSSFIDKFNVSNCRRPSNARTLYNERKMFRVSHTHTSGSQTYEQKFHLILEM